MTLDVNERDLLTERFEQQRPHLQTVAYRMLGSVSEADDALQEAWLRIRDEDPEGIRSMQAWLTTVVGRVCLNRLRSRRSGDGNFEALLAVLAPDIELRIDGGTRRADASLMLRGAQAVAKHTPTYVGLYPHVRPALVNGAAGAVVRSPGKLFSVMAFTVTNGKITRIDALLDPDRLAALEHRILAQGNEPR